MTKQEFEQRTGLKVTDDDFNEIHSIYMSCGDELNKDDFCKMYTTKEGRGDLLALLDCQLWVAVHGYELASTKVKNLKESAGKKDARLAEFLIRKSHEFSDGELYDEAVALVGQREVVAITLRLDLPLYDSDLEYVKTHLK